MSAARLRAALPLLVAFGLVAVAFAGWRPLLDPRFFQSHDGFEHAYRALAMATAVRQGVVLPRWVPELALGFGYPLFAVYSPLSYYPPALLSLAGLGVLTALKVDLAALAIASAASAYYAARALGGRWAGLVAAAGYACAPYALANAYIRLDLAELSTFPLTALVAGGLLRLDLQIRQARLEWSLPTAHAIALTALPLALLPLTHSLSTMTFMPTLLALSLALLVGSWRSGCARNAAAALVALGILALGLSAWFVLPAVQWQGWLRLADLGSDSNFAPKLLDVPRLLLAPGRWTAADWFGAGGRRWFLSVAPGPFGELPAFPSYASLAGAAASVVVALASRSAGRRAVVALVAAACLSLWFATTWSSGFWQAFPRLTQLQFPWRVIGPVSLDVALLSAVFVTALPSRAQPAAAIALVVAVAAPAIFLVRPAYRPIDLSAATWPAQMRRELQGGFGTTGSGLFLPTWVTTDLPGDFGPAPLQAPASESASLEISSVAIGPTSVELRYVSAAPRSLVIGTLYAPPWSAKVDGRVVPLRAAAGTGLIETNLPAGAHALSLTLGHTASAEVGAAITLLTGLVAIIALLRAPRACALEPSAPVARSASPWKYARGVAQWKRVLPCLPLLATVVGAAGANVIPTDGAASLSAPEAPSEGSALAVAAWRLDPSSVWGTPASLDLLLLARRSISADEDVVVRARPAGGGAWVERRQPPRMGTVATRGWPANLLLEDHALLPGPRELCAGAYEIRVGFAARGQRDLESSQALGVVTVARGNARACAPLGVDATTPAAAAVAGFAVHGGGGGPVQALRPGSDASVRVDLRALGPTDGDDAITLQVLDNVGHVVIQRDSYANVDMVFTSIWRPEDRASIQFQVPIPANLPVGLYHLALGLYSRGRAGFDPIVGPGENRPIAGLVSLASFKVRPAIQPPRVVQAIFGGLFGLRSAAVNGGRDVAAPGTDVPVELVWQSLAPAPDDYTLFVQVLDAAGRLVAQQDGPPLGGRYPTSAWEPGDVVTERRSIALPGGLAPGEYPLVVGWYAQPSGQRLPMVPERADHAMPVGRLIVTK